MSLNIGDNFKYLGKKFLDDRESFATLEVMKKCETVPDGFITYCKENGKRYEFKSSNTIDELTGKWIEFSINASTEDIEAELNKFKDDMEKDAEQFKQETNTKIDDAISNMEIEDCYYLGTEEPENDKIWFLNSRQSEVPEISFDNPIIAELFSCIQSLQAQITTLQAEVEYLKVNGGGGIPIEPDNPDEPEVIEICLALEDGSLFELEDGGFIIMEETIQVNKEPSLILEDGSMFLLEDGSFILLEEEAVSVKDNIMLLENGAEMLLENNYNILIE